MIFDKFQYADSNGKYLPLEKWMKFGIELAHFFKMQPEPVKLYISVPSSLLFSYVFTLGCIDYDFQYPQKEHLIEKYLLLQPGQRILYKVDDDWISHSVERMGEHPISKKRAILLRDRLNTINYVPEDRWSSHIIISNDENKDMRNTRKVNNFFNVLEDNILNDIYEKENLQFIMMENKPNTYICTNKTEWKLYKDTLKFYYLEKEVLLNNFLFDNPLTSFINLGFLEQKENVQLPIHSTIILNGSSRTLRQIDVFNNQKCAIIIDRHELREKIEELHFKIENDFLSGESKVINKRLIEHLSKNNTDMPEGVEIFVWTP